MFAPGSPNIETAVIHKRVPGTQGRENMEKMVLLYHFEGIRLAQAHKALEKLPFRIREVKKEEYGYPLGYISGLPGSLPLGKAYEGPQLEQEMVVFAGFIGDDVDKALEAFRQNGLAGVGLKAVLTETNRAWSSLQLFEELKKEHAQMHGKR